MDLSAISDLHHVLVSSLDERGWWPGSIVIEFDDPTVIIGGEIWHARRTRRVGVTHLYGFSRRQAGQMLAAVNCVLVRGATGAIQDMAADLGIYPQQPPPPQ